MSTNDKDIINICVPYIERYYDKFKVIERPENLCKDTTSMVEVVKHATIGYDEHNTIVILLQPTSPLRTHYDIKNAFDLFNKDFLCISSVYQTDTLHFKLNGAIYIGLLLHMIGSMFESRHLYTMSKERSIDIDTQEDFNEAERLMKERNSNIL